jgi:hypothetical protein
MTKKKNFTNFFLLHMKECPHIIEIEKDNAKKY